MADDRSHPPGPGPTPPPLGDIDERTYLRIKRIAARVVQARLSPTLSATAVAHEVWIRLARSAAAAADGVRDGDHFDALVGQTARFVATDAARRRLAQKRRGARATDADLDQVAAREHPIERILMIRQAIEALAADDADTADVLRDYYWEGWSVAEICANREKAQRSIERTLTFGRAWVHDWLSRNADPPAADHDR